MNWHQIRLEDVFDTPWRNGGGTTRELLAWPHRDEWRARVSIADVKASGAFSEFTGVTRWFAVLSEGGVKLRVGDEEHALDAKSAPLRFDGAAKTECELTSGATQDFNLMLRGCEGSLERVSGRSERTVRKGALVGVYSHDHEVSFLAVEVRIVIPPKTLAWHVMPADERIDFSTQGALWFEVQP